MNASRYIHRMHLRIRTLTALGILATALLAGLATALPFYHASRSATESITQISVEAQADAIHHQLGRYQDVARQFSSRTEIRRRLAQYARGELSREAITTYTTPRLVDAMTQAPDVAGLVRLGPDGEEISRIGTAPKALRLSDTPQEGYPCRFHRLAEGEMLVQACSPILSDEGERIGLDLVFFHAEPLQSLLQKSERFGSQARIRLREANGEYELTLDAQQYDLTPVGEYGNRDSGKQDVAFAVPLGNQGWQLLLDVPSRQFHQEAMELLLWPALVILILAGGGALVVSRALHPLLAKVAQQAQRLESSEQELRLAASVFRNAQEAIAITTPDHRIIDANPAFLNHLGYSHQRLQDRPMARLLAWHPDSQERLRHGQRQLAREGAWQGEVRYRRANGDTLVALQTISAVRDADGETIRYIHIFNDISEQKAAEEQVRHQALHDELTGLPNRTLLEQRLERALGQARQGGNQLAVLFLDLDHFKEVNDTLGHQAGDALLQAVAERLQTALRADDTLSRLGGDEFVIVLHAIHASDNAAKVANNVVDALMAPFTIEETPVTIGVSVGIALYPGDGQSADGLIQAADKAMYRAKAAGRNTWRFHANTPGPEPT